VRSVAESVAATRKAIAETQVAVEKTEAIIARAFPPRRPPGFQTPAGFELSAAIARGAGR
jgi:hypothetical protein